MGNLIKMVNKACNEAEAMEVYVSDIDDGFRIAYRTDVGFNVTNVTGIETIIGVDTDKGETTDSFVNMSEEIDDDYAIAFITKGENGLTGYVAISFDGDVLYNDTDRDIDTYDNTIVENEEDYMGLSDVLEDQEEMEEIIYKLGIFFG